MMPQKALITGATGFVGSHLARRLVNDGWQVHAIIRRTSKFDLVKDIKERIVWYEHDGTMKKMMTIASKSKPDIVFHLASLFLSQHQPDDIPKLIESNITFGTQLVEAILDNGCYNFINTGTSWQHYENEDYNPVNLYAATKQAFEDLLKYYVDAHGLKVITLKLFDTYGPNDPRPKLINLLKRIAKTGETLDMSPGEQKIDLVHVYDVVEAFCVAAERIKIAQINNYEQYGIASNEAIHLKEIVSLVEKHTNKKLYINWGNKEYKDREVMTPWKNYNLLPRWKVKRPLKKYIEDVL